MESDGSGSAVDNKTPTISRLFSAAQTSCLKAYYEAGMRGTGEQFRQLHHKCAEESGLSVVQVMVSDGARMCRYITLTLSTEVDKEEKV